MAAPSLILHGQPLFMNGIWGGSCLTRASSSSWLKSACRAVHCMSGSGMIVDSSRCSRLTNTVRIPGTRSATKVAAAVTDCPISTLSTRGLRSFAHKARHPVARSNTKKLPNVNVKTPTVTSGIRRSPPAREDPSLATPSTKPLRYNDTPGKDLPFAIPGRNLYAQTLASKSGTTLLYLHEQNNAWPFARAAFGGVVGSIALLNIHDQFFFPSPGLWWLVPWMQLVINVGILGGAAYIATRKMRPISRINAEGLQGGLKLIVEGSAGPRVPGTRLELWRPEIVECAIADIKLSNTAMNFGMPLSPRERANLQAEEDARLPRISQSGFRDQMLWPFRQLGRGLKKAFKNGMLLEGTMNVEVKDQHGKSTNWQLDVQDAWMLDHGSALEALLKENHGFRGRAR